MSTTQTPRPRACLVCHQPCTSEGQLCPTCVEAGARVADTEVIIYLTAEPRTHDGCTSTR